MIYIMIWVRKQNPNIWLWSAFVIQFSSVTQSCLTLCYPMNHSTPVLWPPHVKSWLTGKDSDAGRDWGQEEKGTTEDEMAGWHHWLDGHESEWTLGVGDGQGGLECCDSWGNKESDITEQLNWTEWLMMMSILTCTCRPFVCLPWRNVYTSLLAIFKLGLSFCCWVAWVLYIF